MIYIKQILFGVRCDPVDVIISGFHTIYPDNQPDKNTWLQEFRAGADYGKKLIHFD
jgi:hypothetical protein